jgi:hypothetical protein
MTTEEQLREALDAYAAIRDAAAAAHAAVDEEFGAQLKAAREAAVALGMEHYNETGNKTVKAAAMFQFKEGAKKWSAKDDALEILRTTKPEAWAWLTDYRRVTFDAKKLAAKLEEHPELDAYLECKEGDPQYVVA